MRIYLDNAATTFPKAPGLGAAVGSFIDNNGININRGAGEYETERIVYEARELISELFENDATERVVFTSGITASLNILMHGLLKNGDHVIISSMEHHAITRPLELLKREGIEYTAVKADTEGNISAEAFENAIKENTRLILVTHASNVCGTVLPIKEIGEIAARHNIFMAADCAQTAGIIDISLKNMKLDFLAFTGHKGLMGPQGTGGFVISERLAEVLRPHFVGGTGSYSHLYEMPPELPDRFEAGTLNLPGIAGLKHSVEYILKEGITRIRKRENELTEYFLKQIKDLPIRIVGREDTVQRVGVISIVSPFSDNGILAASIAQRGIALRYGLHCAPMAHETLGTIDTGTIRFSVGYFNTEKEIDKTVQVLEELL